MRGLLRGLPPDHQGTRFIGALKLTHFRTNCSKCDFSDITMRYSKRTYDDHHEAYAVAVPKTQTYIDCKCKRCGYTWDMMAADDPDNPKVHGRC